MSSDKDECKRDLLVNQSHIMYSSGSSSYTTYSNTVGIPIVGPMVKVVKSTDECEAVPGRSIHYKVVVSNKGNYAAKVDLYDELPEGMAFVPNSIVKDGVPLPGASLDDGLKLGIMQPGERIRVDFRLVLIPCQDDTYRKYVRNRMKAKISFFSSNGRHVKQVIFSNTVKLPIKKADKPILYAKLSVEPQRAAPGDRLRYVLCIGNQGHASAEVKLVSFVPQCTTFIPNSFTIEGKWVNVGIPAKAGVPLGLLEPGAQLIVTWEVAVAGVNVVSPGQIIENIAVLIGVYNRKDNGEHQHHVIDFHSNRTAVELCFPVIQASLKVKPEVSYPEGVVDFRMILSNTGNRTAMCSAEKLLGGSIHLKPGSLRVDENVVMGNAPIGGYKFGEVAPGTSLKVQFQGVISPLVTTRTVRGQIVILYGYQLNERQHAGETNTNPYAITIMHDHE
ncbi:hypothetical protein ACX1C1_23370 [Paenibacillus sp. strain BS8-2]